VYGFVSRDMGYYYHWMRDGGLCIKTWMDINDNSYEAVRTELEAYAGWVAKETSFNFLFYIKYSELYLLTY
jgi:hypothetical protein